MIDWLRRMLRFPTSTRQLPTDLERTAPHHARVIAKAEKVARQLEDFQRMDGALVIVRRPR